MIWEENIRNFVALCKDKGVKMLLVGGGAVNFHGYQRHSADVDFWIDLTEENLGKLVVVLTLMGFEEVDLPEDVRAGRQNISIKFSPTDELSVELITSFSLTKSFEEAYVASEMMQIEGDELLKWNVLSYDDLIESKIRAHRPKDLLDIQELKRIRADL